MDKVVSSGEPSEVANIIDHIMLRVVGEGKGGVCDGIVESGGGAASGQWRRRHEESGKAQARK